MHDNWWCIISYHCLNVGSNINYIYIECVAFRTLKEKDGTVIDAESKLKVERTHLVQQVKDRDEKLAQTLIECEKYVLFHI